MHMASGAGSKRAREGEGIRSAQRSRRLTGSAAPSTTGAAAAASSTGAGNAAAGTNPLVSSADTFTGTYTTLINQCESPMDAAQNTVSGCCCLKGTATITHTKGQTTAALTASLTVSGGLMCSAGNISVPNL